MINTKNKCLLLGIGLFSVVCYYLALQKTLLLKSESSRLLEQTEHFSDFPSKLNLLQQKNKHYDSILSKMNFNGTSIQNNLIRTINLEAKQNDVKVMDFNQPHLYQLGESNEFTYSFDLSGNFIDVLKVIHEVEIKANFGEIVHLKFEKKKDYKTANNFLNATVLIQQVK